MCHTFPPFAAAGRSALTMFASQSKHRATCMMMRSRTRAAETGKSRSSAVEEDVHSGSEDLASHSKEDRVYESGQVRCPALALVKGKPVMRTPMQQSHVPACPYAHIAGAGHGEPVEYPAASDFYPVRAARHYAVLTAMRQQSGEHELKPTVTCACRSSTRPRDCHCLQVST